MAKNVQKVSALAKFKAITYKSMTLQLRQKKTNACQIVYPGLMMIILLMYQLLGALFQIGGGVGSLTDPLVFGAANTTWDCSMYTTNDTTCGTWNHLYFSNPSNATAGQLTNTTLGNQGLLGRIPQMIYESQNITATYVPFFEQYDSASDIDNAIYNILVNQSTNAENDEILQQTSLQLPTGAINFLEIEDESLTYEVQMGSGYYPPNTISREMLRSSYYINLIDSAFANELFSQFNETISILANSIAFSYAPTIPVFNLTNMLAMFYIPVALGFSLPVFVYMLVLERSNRILVMMKMMGLENWQYRLATYFIYYLYYSVIAIFVSVFVLLIGIDLYWSVNPLTWIILYILWGFGLISFAFFLSAFFSSTRTANIASYLLVLFGFSIGFYTMLFFFPNYYESGIAYYLFLLIPPCAFMRGEFVIGYSVSEVLIPNVSFADLLDITSPLWVTYWFLILDSIIFFLLGCYLDNVLPKTFGVSEHPLYFLQSLTDFIRSKRSKKKVKDEESFLLAHNPIDDPDVDEETQKAHNMNLQNVFVRIRNVVKEYMGRDKKIALDGLSLAINENETFGLLGPNGAGKTTLASIICGLSTQTSGSVIIDGYELPRDLDHVYQFLGFCPQHDILWDELSVLEHLYFYCRLKGIKNVPEEADRLMRGVNLHMSANKRVSDLSGGMKRRLSLCISLVGNPKLVLLDEPTTGLDPVSRRAVWDIINEHMENRCTIITTHNMEEADALCSRIGIVAKGKLRCIGTQMHLKNKFGSGYKLSITATDAAAADQFIKSIVPTAVVNDTVGGGAITYEIRDPDFSIEQLYKEMLSSKQYGILEWGINQSSLEDVFLHIVEQTENQK